MKPLEVKATPKTRTASKRSKTVSKRPKTASKKGGSGQILELVKKSKEVSMAGGFGKKAAYYFDKMKDNSLKETLEKIKDGQYEDWLLEVAKRFINPPNPKSVKDEKASKAVNSFRGIVHRILSDYNKEDSRESDVMNALPNTRESKRLLVYLFQQVEK